MTIILGCSVATHEIQHLGWRGFRGDRTCWCCTSRGHTPAPRSRQNVPYPPFAPPWSRTSPFWDLYKFTAKRSPSSAAHLGRSHHLKVEKTTSNIIVTPKEERCKQEGRHRGECRSKLLCKQHSVQLFGTDTLINKTFFALPGSL